MTVFRFLDIGSEAVLERDCQVILALAKKIIVTKWRTKLNKEKLCPDLLSRFIDLGTEDLSDKDYLTDIVLNFLVVCKQANNWKK